MENVTQNTSNLPAETEVVETPGVASPLMSYRTREIIEMINFVTISAILAAFGICSNIVNIIVFIKHRFGESMNVSLLCLSISDLLANLFLEMFDLCTNPLVLDGGLPILPMGFQYATAGWPHVSFTRITCMITVFVAVERCLCITMPLKVKILLTPRRSLIVISIIYSVMVLSLCPAYISFYVDWAFIPSHNRTLLTLLVHEGQEQMENITVLGNVVLQFFCFAGIIISNGMLLYALKKKTKWRQGGGPTTATLAPPRPAASASGGNEKSRDGADPEGTAPPTANVVKGGAADNAVNRDRKLGRMIMLLSCILFLCYIPSTVLLLIQLAEPEFTMGGRYDNSFFACWSFIWVLDAFNSSINIFVYYNMSTKYRTTFRALFRPLIRKWRVHPTDNTAEHSASHSNLPKKSNNSQTPAGNVQAVASISGSSGVETAPTTSADA